MKLWERALARSAVYEYLSIAFLYPEAQLLEALQGDGETAAELLGLLYGDEGRTHLLSFASAVRSQTLTGLREEFTDAFGHIVSTDCPPYEGEYGQAHIFHKSHSLADLSGFFKAFGLEPDPGLKDRLDHISVELEFMHFMSLKEAHALRQRHGNAKVEICRKGQRSFLEQHLGYWACSFAGRLSELAGGGAYASLARGLDYFVRAEMLARELPVGPRLPVVPEPRADEDPSCYSCPLADSLEPEVAVL